MQLVNHAHSSYTCSYAVVELHQLSPVILPNITSCISIHPTVIALAFPAECNSPLGHSKVIDVFNSIDKASGVLITVLFVFKYPPLPNVSDKKLYPVIAKFTFSAAISPTSSNAFHASPISSNVLIQ